MNTFHYLLIITCLLSGYNISCGGKGSTLRHTEFKDSRAVTIHNSGGFSVKIISNGKLTRIGAGTSAAVAICDNEFRWSYKMRNFVTSQVDPAASNVNLLGKEIDVS
jgi:hypothetical protein